MVIKLVNLRIDFDSWIYFVCVIVLEGFGVKFGVFVCVEIFLKIECVGFVVLCIVILWCDGKNVVFCYCDGVVECVDVCFGVVGFDFVEIVSGFDVGDEVIYGDFVDCFVDGSFVSWVEEV